MFFKTHIFPALVSLTSVLLLLIPTVSAEDNNPAQGQKDPAAEKWQTYSDKLYAARFFEDDPPAEIKDIVQETLVAFAREPKNRNIERMVGYTCAFLGRHRGSDILRQVHTELRTDPRGDFLFAQLMIDLSRRLGRTLPDSGWVTLEEMVDFVLQEEPGHLEATSVLMHEAFTKKLDIKDTLPRLRKVRERHGQKAMFTAILYAPRFTKRLPPVEWAGPLVRLVAETDPDDSTHDISHLSSFVTQMIHPDDHDALQAYVKWVKTLPRRKAIKLQGVTIRLMQAGLHPDLIDWLHFLHSDREDKVDQAGGHYQPNLLEVPYPSSYKPDSLALWQYLSDHELADDLAAALGDHTTSRFKVGIESKLALLSPGPPRERAEAAITIITRAAEDHNQPVGGVYLAELQVLAEKISPGNDLTNELNASMTRMGLAKYLANLSKLPKTAIDTADPTLLRTAWEALQARTGQRVSSIEAKAMMQAHLTVATDEEWARFADEAKHVLLPLPAGPSHLIDSLRAQRDSHPNRTADVLRMLTEEQVMEYIKPRGDRAGWDLVLLAEASGLPGLSKKIESTLTDDPVSQPLLAERLAALRGKADYLRPVGTCQWTGKNYRLNWSLLGVSPQGGPDLAVLPPQEADFDGRFDLEVLAGEHDQLFHRVTTVQNTAVVGSLELEPGALEGCRWIAISIRERNGKIVRQGPSARIPTTSPGLAVLSDTFEMREDGGPFGNASWHYFTPTDTPPGKTTIPLADLDWKPGQNGWVSIWARPPLSISLTGIDRQGEHCGYSRSEGRTQVIGLGGDCWSLIEIPIESSMLPDKAVALRLQGSFNTHSTGRTTIQIAGLDYYREPPSEHDPRLTLLGRVPGAIVLANGLQGGFWFIMDDGSLAHTPPGPINPQTKRQGSRDFHVNADPWMLVRPTGVFWTGPTQRLHWYDAARNISKSLPHELGQARHLWISTDGTILAAGLGDTTVIGRLDPGPKKMGFTEIARCKTPGGASIRQEGDQLLIADELREWRVDLQTAKLTGPVSIDHSAAPDRKGQSFPHRPRVSKSNDDLIVGHERYRLLGRLKSATFRDTSIIALDRFGLIYSLPTELP